MLEKQATSIEAPQAPLVFLKHAANLRGHVLEDTAEVLHSLARTSFGGRGFPPLFFVEKNFFEKVIEKELFGVILRILLHVVKPKLLPPPPPARIKKFKGISKERRIYWVF